MAELDGELGAAREGAAATQLTIAANESARFADIGQELDGARREQAQADSLLRTARDIQDRLVVTSPMAGTVVDLRLTTIGGVLGPGEPLLDIVPEKEPLLIEVR